jgi:SAM-dependent methyltransferase
VAGDVWVSGDAYEPYVGRWSRPVATEFVRWLDPLPDGRWVDIGCGTGAVTESVLREGSPGMVVCLDRSAGYVAGARARVADARARFLLGAADAIPLGDRTADAVVSGLVLNFIPDTAAAVAEMARVTRSGGVVAAYVWDYATGMQMMRHFWDAAGALDPRARELDEGERFPLCRPDALTALFEGARLSGVRVRAIDVPTRFRDFEDYWAPFLGGQGPAPGYAMALDEPRRLALRERIRAGLPYASDGSIPLTARAWAVFGRI